MTSAPAAPVTVYTIPRRCKNCDATTAALVRAGVPFETVSIPDVPGLAADFAARGFQAAPVVYDPDTGETWCGLDPARLQALIARRTAAAN